MFPPGVNSTQPPTPIECGVSEFFSGLGLFGRQGRQECAGEA